MSGMEFATIGGLLAAFTILSSGSAKIKGWVTSIQNVWLEHISVDKNLAAAVYQYCLREMKLSNWRAKVYSSSAGYLKQDNKEKMLAFDILPQSSVWFWKGWRPIKISPGSWRYNQTINEYERAVNIFLPRLIWNSSKFLKDAILSYNVSEEKKIKRFAITRFYGTNKQGTNIQLDDTKRSDHSLSGHRQLIREVQLGRAMMVGDINISDLYLDDSFDRSPFEWYSYPANVMHVVENTRDWYTHRNWYRERKIPWRRGLLLHGEPGTGKTLFLKCLAQEMDLPIFLFDLASMNNQEFANFWGQSSMFSPCMIIFEDIDAVFHGRENITTSESKLSLDSVLGCISGIESNDGVLFAITTNHIEHVDEALGVINDKGISSRPGRIDEVLELQNMDRKCREIMAKRIIGDNTEDIIDQTEGMTAAQFIETCNNAVLRNEWFFKPEKTKIPTDGQIITTGTRLPQLDKITEIVYSKTGE